MTQCIAFYKPNVITFFLFKTNNSWHIFSSLWMCRSWWSFRIISNV